jgi:hypothetical protein
MFTADKPLFKRSCYQNRWANLSRRSFIIPNRFGTEKNLSRRPIPLFSGVPAASVL